jgi:hypothetical protein
MYGYVRRRWRRTRKALVYEQLLRVCLQVKGPGTLIKEVDISPQVWRAGARGNGHWAGRWLSRERSDVDIGPTTRATPCDSICLYCVDMTWRAVRGKGCLQTRSQRMQPSASVILRPIPVRVDDHVVTYAATVLYPKLLLFILGNINTMVVVVYQVEPNISLVLSSIRPANPRPRTRMNETRRLTMA